MITLCKACGTSYDNRHGNVERCTICDDERQYVPVSGQAWMDFDELIASHTNKWQQHTPPLFSLKTVPSFAINQRAFLLRDAGGKYSVGLRCESGSGNPNAHSCNGGIERHRDFASSLLHHNAGLGGGV